GVPMSSFHRHLSLLRASMVCILIALPQVAAAQSVAEVKEETSTSAWQGSAIAYRQSMGVQGLWKSATPTWNPSFVHSLTLEPQWNITESTSVSSELSMASELTQSDWTTDRIYLSDMTLRGTFSNALTSSLLQTTTHINLGVRLPTSKPSRASSLIMAPSLGVITERSFAVAKGLKLSLDLSVSRPMHSYTTGSLQGSPIDGCSSPGCRELMQIPTRNTRLIFEESIQAQLQLFEHTVMTAYVGAGQGLLHSLSPSPLVSFEPDH
ncbi:uncharacterized protein METZ01_LOCUS432482, partial [marine metagenome]